MIWFQCYLILIIWFSDLNLGEVCTEICIDDMIDCINKCQDDDCKRQCARDEAICVDGKLELNNEFVSFL